jgi:PAS domain S-box-containing protein
MLQRPSTSSDLRLPDAAPVVHALMELRFAAAQRLLWEYQRRAEAFEFSPDACVITADAGLIRHANRATAELLERPARYLNGKPLAVFVSMADRAQFRLRLNALLMGEQPDPWQAAMHRRYSATTRATISARRMDEASSISWSIRAMP